MIEQLLTAKIVEAVRQLWNHETDPALVSLQKTRREFEGDFTLVVFPFLKFSRQSPEVTARAIGDYLTANVDEVVSFEVIKGFLNLTISPKYWFSFFQKYYSVADFAIKPVQPGKPVVVEYSSPNTNKPLHLGHIRNNLLGSALSNILEANGKKVIKVNLVNDRGIHICKSMLAWLRWGNGETPRTSGLKGDHLVGKYYVLFDKYFKAEIAELVKNGMDEELAEKEASLIMEAQEMLVQWEEHNPEVRKIWAMMNGWVYDGFDETYKRLGITFDKVYYESDTYLLGRELVEEGLKSNVFFRKPDGSVWCDLTDEGLDEKLLLRADRTTVYMTQDLGTAQLRKDEFDPELLIYVVGNEQNYHFDVLKRVLKRLGRSWSDDMLHLSYGMVELPQGRMKSREGTVVDADDLLDEMYRTAKKTTEELGKTEHFTESEKDTLYQMIGLGALKYYILKVDPRKNMLFNPEESIDFNGNTGPFIQYTHARIRSLFRKAAEKDFHVSLPEIMPEISTKEVSLLKLLHEYPAVISEAGLNYSPALIANYIYELAKEFNQYYQDTPILRENNKQVAAFRLLLSGFAGHVIKSGMGLLGINVPDKM
ncbi:MAG TPA: arginine--tRNA ligase [Bacteroidales bacterium]|nr:arginine--tRNA ligase [Bacteroidales bacterium]HPR57041.1 arginine--tRNA ligase [Bacteroidales bacterium]